MHVILFVPSTMVKTRLSLLTWHVWSKTAVPLIQLSKITAALTLDAHVLEV